MSEGTKLRALDDATEDELDALERAVSRYQPLSAEQHRWVKMLICAEVSKKIGKRLGIRAEIVAQADEYAHTHELDVPA